MARFDLDHPGIVVLVRRVQDGVVSRSQLLDAGATRKDIERLLRRNELCRVHPGVYVNHTGELTRAQREWVAVLSAAPAVLAAESALPGAKGESVRVAVRPGRKVVVPAWVRVERVTDLDARANWRSLPPRMRREHAALDVVIDQVRRDDVPGAFATLAEVTHRGAVTTDQLAAALASRRRVTTRSLIAALIADRASGACSVLERGYLHRVERAHGLPRPTRQRLSTATGAWTVADIRYDEFGVIVELDGRAFHDNPEACDADALRDLAELATSDVRTARLTYGLVFRQPCRTAEWVAELLRRGGWTGAIGTCPRC